MDEGPCSSSMSISIQLLLFLARHSSLFIGIVRNSWNGWGEPTPKQRRLWSVTHRVRIKKDVFDRFCGLYDAAGARTMSCKMRAIHFGRVLDMMT